MRTLDSGNGEMAVATRSLASSTTRVKLSFSCDVDCVYGTVSVRPVVRKFMYWCLVNCFVNMLFFVLFVLFRLFAQQRALAAAQRQTVSNYLSLQVLMECEYGM